MKKSVVLSVFLLLTASFTSTVWAVEDVIVRPWAARVFAKLPAGVVFPEGITVNPATGRFYVSTFRAGPSGPDNMLLRFSADGMTVEAQINFDGAPLLGLAFNPDDNKVYICNFGASQIQRVNADFTDADAADVVEVVANVPHIGAPSPRTVGNPDGTTDQITFGITNDDAPMVFPAPNALAFKANNGNLFFSDSFQGAIFKIKDPTKAANTCPGDSSCVTTVSHSPLLATAGFPPFGANGLVFRQSKLYIANTGDDRILRLNLGSGAIDVFAESINGADGLTLTANGNFVVAANQADNVLILDGATGLIKAKLGDFLGFNPDGTVHGLLFPASVAIANIDGPRILVTNLALPLRGTPDEPETSSALTTYTVSKIRIPAGF